MTHLAWNIPKVCPNALSYAETFGTVRNIS
jgi:hypothetical protein